MITIRPFGGIGNRIRSIDSVIGITQDRQIPFTIIWERTPSLNCNFEELFSLPNYISVINKNGKETGLIYKLISITKEFLFKIGINTPLGYNKYLYQKDIVRLMSTGYDFHQLNNIERVYIDTQTRFYSNGKEFELFKPVPKIINKVDEIIQSFTEYTVGIHIRRTDNFKSIDNSPVEEFIKFMEKEIELNSDVSFFLATDSSEVESELRSKFKYRIIKQSNIKLKRNDPIAIKDALVDLLCLSRTKKIYGSYWSSFSEVAALFGKIPLQIVVKNQI
ncbi:MAG: hypothetical protein JXB00_11440 [Bacteroidales bacterium]|nr:hypothetical protein [Bacteroidales bacterium]